MLKHYGNREDESSCSSADAKTLAAARTSTGLLIRVAFSLPPPPAMSRLLFHLPDAEKVHAEVVAAHGDSVLIDVHFSKQQRRRDDNAQNYFVYNAGAAAAEPPRPPSLSQLRRLHAGTQISTTVKCKAAKAVAKSNIHVVRSTTWYHRADEAWWRYKPMTRRVIGEGLESRPRLLYGDSNFTWIGTQ
jgi:hypothetical protein